MSIRENSTYLTMTPYRACEIAEGFGSGEESTREEQECAWQWILDTGIWKQLQGFYGRTVFSLLEDGLIEPPLDK